MVVVGVYGKAATHLYLFQITGIPITQAELWDTSSVAVPTVRMRFFIFMSFNPWDEQRVDPPKFCLWILLSVVCIGHPVASIAAFQGTQ
jgi:hypothetical protein